MFHLQWGPRSDSRYPQLGRMPKDRIKQKQRRSKEYGITHFDQMKNHELCHNWDTSMVSSLVVRSVGAIQQFAKVLGN